MASVQAGLQKGPKKPGAAALGSGGTSKGGNKTKNGDELKKKEADKDKPKGKGKERERSDKGAGKGEKGKSDKPKGEKGKGAKDHDKSKDKPKTEEKGECVFFPQGLCRRGDQCPYKHTPKTKNTPVPKVGMVALVGSILASAATALPVQQTEAFSLSWALDSGAGEHLSSRKAFIDQGVPETCLDQCETTSSMPLHFETGGGAKLSSTTVGLQSPTYGEGVVYMLKSCPFVKSLGKLRDLGFSFFWGPDHQATLVPPGETFVVFVMTDYAQEAINLYQSVVGNVVFKKVATPYVNEGVLTEEGYLSEGQVSAKASSVLMKLLWLCRLSRPDLAYAISMLAVQVSKWSRNADKQLYRLMCYLETTKSLCLTSKVCDPPEDCTLDLFVDADLGGCVFSAKSTTGVFLVVRGPRGTFAPVTWFARRQQHVARSTADAELNALSEGLHEEALPALMLLELLLGANAPKLVIREDNSAVVQAIRKGYSHKLRHWARTPALNHATKTVCSLALTPTKDQLGDLFTKVLTPMKFNPQVLGLSQWATAEPVGA